MPSIDLSSLTGTDLTEKLLTYVRDFADIEKKFHLITPVPLPGVPQRGETCKLKALAIAIEYAAQKAGRLTSIPLYKSRSQSISLRQLAKMHGSAVGEMYSLETLIATCHDAGFIAESYAPYNEDDYISQLEELLDKHLTPMIFFDINLTPGEREGFPQIAEGSNEHAAMVVGYYKNKYDETHFIVTFWNNYYDFDGMELALSACYSLAKKRKPETFCKVRDDSGITSWHLPENIHKHGRLLEYTPMRTASPQKDSDTPLKGKILVVTSPLPQISVKMPPLTSHDKSFFAAVGLGVSATDIGDDDIPSSCALM